MLSRRAQLVLDTLLPSHAHALLPFGLVDAGFEKFYTDFLQTANATLRYGFQVALLTAIWISPLLIGRVPPITSYDRETRERALLAMENSRFYTLRQMMLMLKTVACLRYGGNLHVRDAIGYPRQFDDPRNEPGSAPS